MSGSYAFEVLPDRRARVSSFIEDLSQVVGDGRLERLPLPFVEVVYRAHDFLRADRLTAFPDHIQVQQEGRPPRRRCHARVHEQELRTVVVNVLDAADEPTHRVWQSLGGRRPAAEVGAEVQRRLGEHDLVDIADADTRDGLRRGDLAVGLQGGFYPGAEVLPARVGASDVDAEQVGAQRDQPTPIFAHELD